MEFSVQRDDRFAQFGYLSSTVALLARQRRGSRACSVAWPHPSTRPRRLARTRSVLVMTAGVWRRPGPPLGPHPIPAPSRPGVPTPSDRHTSRSIGPSKRGPHTRAGRGHGSERRTTLMERPNPPGVKRRTVGARAPLGASRGRSSRPAWTVVSREQRGGDPCTIGCDFMGLTVVKPDSSRWVPAPAGTSPPWTTP
jgi:hypothetical protein